MFRRLHPVGQTVRIFVDGKRIDAAAGDSVAAALLAAGYLKFRRSPRGGHERAPVCMIGNCFECLCEIDGIANRQSCLVPVSEDMRVRLDTW
ncbi:MAG: 2Fe-2S iron-sulfur cluster-binding protein [Parvibaculaceae bacterium]